MKKLFLTLSLFAAAVSANAQWSTTPVLLNGCPGPNFPGTGTPNTSGIVCTDPMILHAPQGGLGFWSTWSTIGATSDFCQTIGGTGGMSITPNDPNLYGYSVYSGSDKCFFGMRNTGTNDTHQPIIAWGDNDGTDGNASDAFYFEFHPYDNPRRTAMTLLPLPVSVAHPHDVNIGIGTTTPSEQLHTTGGVRFTGLSSGTPNNLVAQDASGKLIQVPYAGNTTAASDGITFTTSGGTQTFQLGYPCSQARVVSRNPFTLSRTIDLNNYNLYFNSSDAGKVFIGFDDPLPGVVSNCRSLATRLEISSNGLGATNTLATGPSRSGLRFTDLTNTEPTLLTNPTDGVLSLDAEGDVIWVKDKVNPLVSAANGCSYNVGANTVEFGRLCGSSSGATLVNDRELPLADHNVIFSDANATMAANKNRVGIGSDPGCLPGAKLEVIRNSEASVYDNVNKAISAVNRDVATGIAVGVYGEANNPLSPDNAGGDFVAVSGAANSYGVRGASAGRLNSYGGFFTANGSGINIGVFADAAGGVNPFPGGPSYAGYFNGDVFNVNNYTPSDRRIKQNIEPITNALAILSSIHPKKYQFNTGVYPGLHLPENTVNYGVISQELEEVLPSLVKETPVPDGKNGLLKNETIKAVNYTELIPILVQAINDQQAQIRDQAALLKKQQDQIDRLLQQFPNSGNSADPVKTDASTTALEVFPNPTRGELNVHVNIPMSAKSASVIITDVSGKKVLDAPVDCVGDCNVHVQLPSATVPAGELICTLVIDGRQSGAKKFTLLK